MGVRGRTIPRVAKNQDFEHSEAVDVEEKRPRAKAKEGVKGSGKEETWG